MFGYLLITLRYCRFRYGRSGTVFSSARHNVTWPVHFHAVLAHTALPSIPVPRNTLLLVRCCHHTVLKVLGASVVKLRVVLAFVSCYALPGSIVFVCCRWQANVAAESYGR